MGSEKEKGDLMAIYMDADALLKHLNDYALQESSFPFNRKAFYAILDCMKAVIEQPTADVAPIVHGEWIPQDMTYTKFMCNQCNSKNHSGHEKFCPNCGADMRKKVEE